MGASTPRVESTALCWKLWLPKWTKCWWYLAASLELDFLSCKTCCYFAIRLFGLWFSTLCPLLLRFDMCFTF